MLACFPVQCGCECTVQLAKKNRKGSNRLKAATLQRWSVRCRRSRRRGGGRTQERHVGKKKRDHLLLLKLLLVFLSQVLDDTLMRLHQQTVLLVPLAVQQISLPGQRLIPA